MECWEFKECYLFSVKLFIFIRYVLVYIIFKYLYNGLVLCVLILFLLYFFCLGIKIRESKFVSNELQILFKYMIFFVFIIVWIDNDGEEMFENGGGGCMEFCYYLWIMIVFGLEYSIWKQMV